MAFTYSVAFIYSVHLRRVSVAPAARAQVYRMGLLGAALHMAEILPLVSLLVGLITLPSIPGSILIAVSEPVTCGPAARPAPARAHGPCCIIQGRSHPRAAVPAAGGARSALSGDARPGPASVPARAGRAAADTLRMGRNCTHERAHDGAESLPT